MYPSTFEYYRAESVADAIDLLESNANAELLAGGQSLVPLQKTRLARPEAIIDLSHIEDIDYVIEEAEAILVGAMTRHTTIQRSDAVREHVALFSECISQIADWQVRNQGTIGGTIAEADPAGDYLPPLKLLNPDIIVTGADGERVIPFEDFYLGMFTVDLQPAEMITEVRIPKLTPVDGAESVGSAYLKHSKRSGDFAIVGVAAIVHLDESHTIVDAKVAVGAVGPLFRSETAESIVIGSGLEDAILEEVSEVVRDEATSDQDGRVARYQEEMSGVFAKRALQSAFHRAMEEK